MEDDCDCEQDEGHQHQFVMMRTMPSEYKLRPGGWVRCNWCDGVIMTPDDVRVPTFLHCQLRSNKEWQPECFVSDLTVLDLVHKRERLGMDWSQDLGMHPRLAPKKMCDADMCWACYERLKKEHKFIWPPPADYDFQY